MASTLDDGAKALTQRFVVQVLLAEGKLFPAVETMLNELQDKQVDCQELDYTLTLLKIALEKHVSVAVEAVETFYADELKKMLDAPIRVSMSTFGLPVSTREGEDEGRGPRAEGERTEGRGRECECG